MVVVVRVVMVGVLVKARKFDKFKGLPQAHGRTVATSGSLSESGNTGGEYRSRSITKASFINLHRFPPMHRLLPLPFPPFLSSLPNAKANRRNLQIYCHLFLFLYTCSIAFPSHFFFFFTFEIRNRTINAPSN